MTTLVPVAVSPLRLRLIDEMGPALDAAHSCARTNSMAWKGGKPSAPPIL